MKYRFGCSDLTSFKKSQLFTGILSNRCLDWINVAFKNHLNVEFSAKHLLLLRVQYL